MKYITVKKLSELTGEKAQDIYDRITKGIWLKDIHWIKSPDGRLQFNTTAIELWIEGGQA